VHSVLSSVVVKVGVYGVIRVVTLLFTDEADVIEEILILLGLIGIYFGSLAAMRTYNAKRMLAYSTFGQVGFILVGIGWGSALALLGALVYAVNHAFIKSSLLMLTGVVSSHTKTKAGDFVKLHGAGRPLIIVSILYFLGGLALAGIPPMNGFISKVVLLQGGIDAQGWSAVALVVAAGALTLLYMMRAWSLMFQEPADENSVALKEPGQGDSWLAPAMLIGISLFLGLYAAPLVEVAQITVDQLLCSAAETCTFNPYIEAVLGSN